MPLNPKELERTIANNDRSTALRLMEEIDEAMIKCYSPPSWAYYSKSIDSASKGTLQLVKDAYEKAGWIIEYKTGTAHNGAGFSFRPKE